MRQNRVSRRQFLHRAAALSAVPSIFPGRVLGLDGNTAPSDRITVGFVGTGGHGIGRNLKGFLRQPDAQAVAVCDVDRGRRLKAKQLVEKHYADAQAKGAYKGCDDYNDFREVIARDDIDAIMNSTPDHWHTIPSLMAVRAGKDVICEKPLTLTVEEGRVLADAVAKHERVFQTASENRSDKNYLRMCELVRNGRIGKLQHIDVKLPTGAGNPKATCEERPVPEGFDYDMWLGQAPMAPYCPERCHFHFRWILDYSGGMLTDWGAHMIDIAQWGHGTETTGPVEIEGSGRFASGGLYDTARTFNIDCKFADGVTMNIQSASPGIRFVGSEGWIGNDRWRGPLSAEPASILDSEIKADETRLYTCAGGEHRNFLDCVKSRKPCYAPAEVGHRTITIAHLGNIAMILGRKLRWNPEEEKFIDDAEADKMLSREMREPWTLEA
jgi:predicted dehydrogenase